MLVSCDFEGPRPSPPRRSVCRGRIYATVLNHSMERNDS
jgi:hypothetical protein